MLKKLKAGRLGMTVMVILMFIAATLNVGTVNATVPDQKSTDKKPAELKNIKKHINGIGDVTAREDMFVGEGDNISLVLNKDYKEIGAITPIIENATVPDTVTIETPYGKVVTSREQYNKYGEDLIIADQKAFIEERERLIKSGMINQSTDAPNIFQRAETQTSYIPKPRTLSTFANTETREDIGFTVIPVLGYTPDGIYGGIYPYATSSLPIKQVTSFHELELHLERNGDVCEFISQHASDGRSVWVALFIDGQSVTGLEFLKIKNVNNQIEFYFRYIPAPDDLYEIRLYNPATGESHTAYVAPTYTSHYIGQMSASTELTYPPPIPPFYAYSTITQWVAYHGSLSDNPANIFMTRFLGDNPYVEVSHHISQDNYCVTEHSSGNTVS